MAGRVCLFCERPRKLTREHLLADWVRRSYAMPRNAATFDRTVRQVCESCNSGWLSDIEDRAKPALWPMFTGHKTTLDHAAQLAAATWAYKTALLLDRAAGGGIVMNDGDPLWFHEHRVPAPNVVLFIGAVRPLASNFSRSWRSHSEFTTVDTKRRPHVTTGFSVTFNVRHLIVQMLGHDFHEHLVLGHPGERHGSMLRICPSTNETVTWPPRLIFDEKMLETLSKLAPGRDVRIPPPDPSQYGDE